MRASLLPTARAASANSRSRKLRKEALTKRATAIHESAPIIRTITPKLSARFRGARGDDRRQDEQERKQRDR